MLLSPIWSIVVAAVAQTTHKPTSYVLHSMAANMLMPMPLAHRIRTNAYTEGTDNGMDL